MLEPSQLQGNIPGFYNDLYNVVFADGENLDRNLFMRLHSPYLSWEQLGKVWDLMDNCSGYITKTGYFKGLALIALAQQGKPIDEKQLELYEHRDLPSPSMGDVSQLPTTVARLRRERNPCLLQFNFRDLTETDTIAVNLLSEKKGFLVKHNEYEVTSQRFNCTVLRRYTDFTVFRQLLLHRYPYRIVPDLPPKRLLSQIDKNFLDRRRRLLYHFLIHVARHPIFRDDEILKFFFTFQGGKVEDMLRETFKTTPDEFMTNDFALQAKELVAVDTAQHVEQARAHILTLLKCVANLREIAERMTERTRGFADDMVAFSSQLKSLGSTDLPVTKWASGGSNTWSILQPGLRSTADLLHMVSDKAMDQAVAEKDGTVDQLDSLLMLLQGYKELLDRHERGVLMDHRTAIQKMSSYKKKKMLATVAGPGSQDTSVMEHLEDRIIQHESALADLEQRNLFSLFCLQLETQLVHANLDMLYFALLNMNKINLIGHQEMSEVWKKLSPLIESMLPTEGSTACKRPE